MDDMTQVLQDSLYNVFLPAFLRMILPFVGILVVLLVIKIAVYRLIFILKKPRHIKPKPYFTTPFIPSIEHNKNDINIPPYISPISKSAADAIGTDGERIASYYALPIHGYGKILRNVYLPLSNGETTEIDIILIHTNGIFVIESKNYKGWIFGKDTDKKWTVMYSKTNKHTFYSPILQNKRHVQEICKITGINANKVFSFIVFGRNSELKKITNNQPNTFVIRSTGLSNKLKMTMEENGQLIDALTVKNLFEKLKPYGEVSEQVKESHIEYVQKLKKQG